MLQVRQKLQDFGGLAAVAEDDDDVVAADQADAAVQGVRGVEEDRGRARARQRGGDLLRDVARLADADRDDLAAARREEFDRALDLLARDARRRARDGLRLHAEQRDDLFEVGAVHLPVRNCAAGEVAAQPAEHTTNRRRRTTERRQGQEAGGRRQGQEAGSRGRRQ